MNKVGLGVVPHPSKAKGCCYVPNLSGWQIRDADVDGLPFHMEALLGHAVTFSSQCLIGLL